MATDVERLIVTLEASTKKYENALNKAKSQTDKQSAAIDKRFRSLSQQIDSSMGRSGKAMSKGFDLSGISRSFGGLGQQLTSTTGLVGIATASLLAAGAAVAGYGDTWNQVGNRLKAAGVATQDLGDEQGRVANIALDSHSSLETTVDLYSKMIGVARSMGLANDKAADATQAVSQALSVAGVSAEAASGTITQLGQALGSGVLRGDEFNSIMESLGTQSPLIQSIAREFGVTANQLRDLAAAGKLTSDRVFKAIVAAKPDIEAIANNAMPSLSQAWNDVTTATTRWVATMLGGKQIAGDIAAGVDDIARRMNAAADAYERLSKQDAEGQTSATLAAPADAQKKVAELEQKIAQLKAAGWNDDDLRAQGYDRDLEYARNILALAVKQADVKKEEMATVQKISDLQSEMLRETARAQEMSRDRNPADPGQDLLDKRSSDLGLSDKDRQIAKATDDIIAAMKKAGTKLDGVALYDAARTQAEKEYQLQVGSQATEAIVKAYVDRVVKAESSGDPRAKNPNSTASGVGQFVDQTWLSLFRKYYPQQAADMGREAILALKSDSDVSRNLIEKYAEENSNVLRKAGVSVNEAALQLSHFLGAGDAAKVLKAAPGTPLQGLISQKSINANPSILGGGKTVDDAISYANARATDTRTAAGDLSADERRKQTLDEIIKANNDDIASMQRKGAALTQNAYTVDYLATRQELLNQATQAGVALTPQVIAALDAQAKKHAAEAAAQDMNRKKTQELQQAQQALADLGFDAFSSLIDGSKDFKGALEDLLKSLAKLVLQAALLGQGPFGNLFGGGATGGGVGGLFGSLFKMFDTGGYTGNGGKHQPAGVVHRGEYVFDQNATKRIGVANLERLRSGLPGFANGGYVGGSMVSMAASVNPSRLAGFSRPVPSTPVTISIDARGATQDSIPRLQQELVKLRRDIPAIVTNARMRGAL